MNATGTATRDARHTVATVLLILGVPERVVMQIMGWSSTAMAARYQHVTGGILADVAQQVGGLIREVAKTAEEDGSNGSAEAR
ncbi:tyrosine-type recombinase/integrase [Streptomyces sp. NBC_01431]|uniref:tyrosine-type recombinase/integrase n=1 Tax=Streptomyces sp. NBC_01431 TaxID=2903863 RepID=UPI003FCE4631